MIRGVLFFYTSLLAIWTVMYHLGLLWQISAQTLFYCFALFSITYVASIIKFRIPFESLNLKVSPVAIVQYGTYFVLSFSMLFVFNSNADDYTYFRRVIDTISDLGSPISLYDSSHAQEGLPPLSILHVLSSYEMLIGLFSVVLGLDALNLYQNISSFVHVFLLLLVYQLLFEKVLSSRPYAFIATVGAFLFLILEGNLVRSFGNFSIVRMWQGKVITVSLLAPLAIYYSIEYFQKSTLKHWMMLFLVCICGIGTSPTGLYYVPLVIMMTSISLSLSNTKPIYEKAKLICLAGCSTIYCVVLLMLVQLDVLSLPVDQSMPWGGGNQHAVWWHQMTLVFGNTSYDLIRYIGILILPLLIKIPMHWKKFLFVYHVIIAVLVFNPLAGSILMEKVTPAGYWRLAYIVLLPFCFGLIISHVSYQIVKKRFALGLFAVFSVLAIYGFKVQKTVFHGVGLKQPFAYRLPRQENKLVEDCIAQLHNQHLLAPSELAWTVGLLVPSLTLESGRDFETEHKFSNMGARQEGEERAKLQRIISGHLPLNKENQALLNDLPSRMTTLVLSHDIYNQLTTHKSDGLNGWYLISNPYIGNHILLSRQQPKNQNGEPISLTEEFKRYYYDNSVQIFEFEHNRDQLILERDLKLKKSQQSGLELESTGVDPILLFPPQPIEPNYQYLFYASVLSSEDAIAQLFFSEADHNGYAYSEKNSFKYPIKSGDNHIFIVLNHNNLGQYFRFDPVNLKADLLIKDIQLHKLVLDSTFCFSTLK